MSPAARRVLNLVGLVIALGGVIAALTLLFIPLPPITTLGTAVAWCGPSATSDNALQVRIDPAIVNTGTIAGSGTPSQSQQAALIQVCTGEADSRITDAAVVALAAIAFGFGVPLIARRAIAVPPGDA